MLTKLALWMKLLALKWRSADIKLTLEVHNSWDSRLTPGTPDHQRAEKKRLKLEGEWYRLQESIRVLEARLKGPGNTFKTV